MLKKQFLKNIITSTLALIITFLIIYSNKNNSIKDYQKVNIINAKTIPIYAVDNENYVARTNIYKKDDANDITYLIKALTINSEESLYLPENFHSTIPEHTQLLNYKLDNNNLILNFSEEFTNIDSQNEENLISSLIYSLCEIKNINSISILINDLPFSSFKDSRTTIPTILDKSFGINKVYDNNKLINTSYITTYYTKTC